ncbi:hypothetical protein RUM44_005211 [Polyplax serrata]|uniref:Uncharacterized protein n=1 Tax=Polyplax serrata TaxID=468196 RepID=A0ABR1AFQ1_POLSC
MSTAGDVMIKFQGVLNRLGTPIEAERDPKINVALRSQLCYIRDEINLANKAFIIVRRAALKRLIESDYNRYVKELRKFDSAITRTQP